MIGLGAEVQVRLAVDVGNLTYPILPYPTLTTGWVAR